MKMKRSRVMGSLLLAGAAALFLSGAALATPAQPHKPTHKRTPAHRHFVLSKHYTLGGTDNWDYLAVDPARHHLFISRASHVEVIDTRTGKPVADIADTDGVHGFAFAQDQKLGFITNGRANTIAAFDLDTLKVVTTIDAGGQNPDAIAYAPGLARMYISNGKSHSVSALDVDSRKIVATMDIGGKPEALAAGNEGKMFVAVEDKNEIVAMDGKSNTVLSHWPLAGCEEPSGMAIDVQADRLFAVCSNKRMVVVDAQSGRVIATLPIGEGPDAAAFDPALKLVFSANGEDGTLTVLHEDGLDHYHVVQNLRTKKGARTMALDGATHRIYLVTAAMTKFPAATGSGDGTGGKPPRQKPKVREGTFMLLVVEPK
jgi:DNA-binding beta-propeller fold protein YncE